MAYRTSMARSMYYSGAPTTSEAVQTNDVNGSSRKEAVGATGTGPPQEARSTKHSQDRISPYDARAKPARPGLTVCIPPTKSKRPVEKSHLSPNSALDNPHALHMASRDVEMVRPVRPSQRVFFPSPEAKTPAEKSAFSATSTTRIEHLSAGLISLGTPASSGKTSAPAGRSAVKASRKVNLSDELALFSITSDDEELSAVVEKPSTESVEVVSALPLREPKSSVHDFAHEGHRDLATKLTPGCLNLARRLAHNGGAGPEGSKFGAGSA
ncbi:MAG: hypothetical protein LQ338_007062 [Usnochroma carphineum]|nr:MAG: hypothetical protein LQ338_007062 [Usnochroma carphineum]